MSGDVKTAIITMLMWLPIILISLSLHESMHAYAAYKLGDPTARNFGRVTLNPLKHLDPVGFVAMLLVGFGWAKPCPVNTRLFENPRKGMALTALAGPVSNLLLAVVFAIFASLTVFTGSFFGVDIINEGILGWITYYNPAVASETTGLIFNFVFLFFYYGVFLNVSLAVFNLLPVPPLDGSRIVGLFLPPKAYFSYMKYERYIGIAFMVAVIVLGRMGISVIGWATEPISDGILWLVGASKWML